MNAREVSDKLPKVFRPREEKENGGDDDSNVNSVDFQVSHLFFVFIFL